MTRSLTIRGGRIVLPDRVVRGDLLIIDGLIEQIAPAIERPTDTTVDASGAYVLPGAIDPWVRCRLGSDGMLDDVSHTTAAALAGGTTSVVIEDPYRPLRHHEALEHEHDKLGRFARTHYALHAHVRPDDLGAVHDLHPAATLHIDLCEPGWTEASLTAFFQTGPHRVLVEGCLHQPAYRDEDGFDPSQHTGRYPPEDLAGALERVAHLARIHGVRTLWGATSTPAELAVPLEPHGNVSRQALLPHIALDATEAYAEFGTQAVINPALQPAPAARILSEGLTDGRITLLATGHANVPPDHKADPYPLTPPWLPTLHLRFPLLMARVAEGELTWPQVAHLTSQGPARWLGVRRKGRIEIGYDADLVVFDPAGHTPPGWGPMADVPHQGAVKCTLLKGRLAYWDGQVPDGIRGRPLHMAPPTLTPIPS